MGKINKFANVYDKDGNCTNHVGEDGVLHNYTMEQLEKLVDELGNDKDENGKIRNMQAFNNASSILFRYYQQYGNPHEAEIIDALTKLKERSTDEQVKDALEEVQEEVTEPEPRKETVMDEYVDYEEVEAA